MVGDSRALYSCMVRILLTIMITMVSCGSSIMESFKSSLVEKFATVLFLAAAQALADTMKRSLKARCSDEDYGRCI